MIGKTISHYRIVEKLGEGGMGRVYKAEDIRLHRIVALKFLPRDLAFNEEAKGRFMREAQAASALDHPNVCTIYEVEETDGGISFIAMAYCGGKSLKEKIDQGRLEINDAVAIVLQIASGLQKAHEIGLVHRDIKPANILFTEEGRAKIADFGLAKLRGQSRLTNEKMVLGTIHYMSPEQTRGEEIDHRTDIWSLGCLLYEMLSGHTPFRGDYDQAIIYAILNTSPAPLTGLRSEVPPELERIVEKCLAKAPSDRYQSVAECIADLKNLARGTRMSTRMPLKLVKDIPRNHRNVYLMAAALVIIAVAAGIIFKPFSQNAVKSRKAIAVLPFSNLTGSKEEEYFSDGITDDILTQLYKIGDLKVISRTTMQQYKETRKTVRQIGTELNVNAVLEGSVRRSGDRVRIVAQLIDAQSDDHLWAENYDREMKDVFDVQTEIAAQIVGSLQATLSPAEREGLANPVKTSPDAYNAYLQGRFFLNRRTKENIEKAIAYFEQALRIDSNYAPAWVGLSQAHSGQADGGYVPLEEGYRRAKEENARALRLNPNLAEAQARLAWIRLTYDWDWNGAEEALKRALELEPGNASVVQDASVLAGTLGRLDDAISLAHRALELDPLPSTTHYNLGLYAYYAGRWQEAEMALRKALELHPQYPGAHLCLGRLYLAQSKPEEALREIRQEPEHAWQMFGFPLVYYALGRKKEADESLAAFVKEFQDDAAYQVAEIYAFRGEADSTFAWLERAYRQRDGGLADMKGDPLLRGIQNDPRFPEFMRKMKLPI